MANTYGASGSPASATFNYDALVSTSLANYRSTLMDNIGSINSFFYDIYNSDQWESRDGGLYLVEDLMYALTPVDSYSGYDELPTTPPDGLTQAQFPWSQCAVPIAVSEEERKKNKHRIVDLVQSRIMQAEIGIKEYFGKAFLQGNLLNTPSSNVYTPYVSPANGSTFIDPLFKLIDFAPTASRSVGNIDQSLTANAFWRNRTMDMSSGGLNVTTYDGYIAKILNFYNTTSRGTGGPPTGALCDQVSWELLALAYYKKYLANMGTDGNFPFPNLKFFDCKIVWDEFIPDIYNNTLTPLTGLGTFCFYNKKFFKVCYESETNFVTTDFQKPVNQDAKVKHILWMGGVTINQRRKQGVIGGIARSLT